jgi:hypothetical protein
MLLKAGQGASGGDLCMFLMDVYGKAELKPDTTNKARLLSLLREFPEGEPTRKRFAGEVIGYIQPASDFAVHQADPTADGHPSWANSLLETLSSTTL